jgi:acyl dehydratase
MLDPAAVGQFIGRHDFTPTVRDTMAWAAGVGATDDAYLDDLRPGGVVAPPPFVVSLEWPVWSGESHRALLGATQRQVFECLHVQQDSTFLRPIRPGMRLSTRGTLVKLAPTSAGALGVARLDTTDLDTGEAVATGWFHGIFLRVPVRGEARESAAPPALRREAAVSEPRRIEIPVARELGHVYTECARIWNPIHTERAAAHAAKLPDILLHGTCTWALAGLALVRACGGGDPLRLRRLAGRFKGMVIPGRPITLEYRQEGGSVDFAVRNADGALAIANGVAEFGDPA